MLSFRDVTITFTRAKSIGFEDEVINLYTDVVSLLQAKRKTLTLFIKEIAVATSGEC